jgi:hypothetical protein
LESGDACFEICFRSRCGLSALATLRAVAEDLTTVSDVTGNTSPPYLSASPWDRDRHTTQTAMPLFEPKKVLEQFAEHAQVPESNAMDDRAMQRVDALLKESSD